MSISELGSLGEFISSFAVFATLVYLVIQLRQNNNAIQGANELELTRQDADFTSQIISDSELQDLWHRAATQRPMNAGEQLKYLWLMVKWFQMCEGVYRLRKRNLIQEDAWELRVTTTIAYLQQPIVAEWFDANTAKLPEDFRAYLQERRDDHALNWRVSDAAEFIDNLSSQDDSHKD